MRLLWVVQVIVFSRSHEPTRRAQALLVLLEGRGASWSSPLRRRLARSFQSEAERVPHSFASNDDAAHSLAFRTVVLRRLSASKYGAAMHASVGTPAHHADI